MQADGPAGVATCKLHQPHQCGYRKGMVPIRLPCGFDLVREQDVVIAVRSDWHGALEEAGVLTADAARVERVAGVQRLGGRGSVFCVPIGDRGRVVVRCARRGGIAGRFLGDRYWGARRAFAELEISEAMRAEALPVPETLGVVAQRCFGPFWRFAIITREITDVIDLASFLRVAPARGARLAALDATAQSIRRMHELRFLHADLQARNILVRVAAERVDVHLVDLDRARQARAVSERERERNLFRLHRSTVKLALQSITAADRLRFVRAYFGGLPQREVLRALARRCQRHVRWHQWLWKWF